MLIIGIAGGTGCGKTTIVEKIVNDLKSNEISVISQDSYYKDLSHLSYDERVKINFDHPDSLDFDLLKRHLLELKNGKSILQPVYSFKEHNRTEQTTQVTPCKVLIVEGILIFTNTEIRDLFDIKIYVEADADERLVRRIRRDTVERGRDVNEVLHRYQTTLKPMHQQFIAPTKNFADMIIPNNEPNSVAIDILKMIIYNRIFF